MSRKHSKSASAKTGNVMHEFKRGNLKGGRSGKLVKNHKKETAIGLGEARKRGAMVPRKKRSSK